MLKIMLYFLTLSGSITSLNSPDHCYDFVSTSVIDSCGSVHFAVTSNLGSSYLSEQWLSCV